MMRIILVVVSMILGGCLNVPNNVKSVGVPKEVGMMCIQINPRVMVPKFDSILRGVVESEGYVVQFYMKSRPKECEYAITYVARRKWGIVDMPMVFARFDLYSGSDMIGTATYGSRRLGLPIAERWKGVRERISPTIKLLFVGTR